MPEPRPLLRRRILMAQIPKDRRHWVRWYRWVHAQLYAIDQVEIEGNNAKHTIVTKSPAPGKWPYTVIRNHLLYLPMLMCCGGIPWYQVKDSLATVILKDMGKLDTQIVDNAERVDISALALLKMLRHGRAGVPMEVMGLMLGEFVDDYTVKVVDVFAMPQSGTGVSVEAVDPVFQTKMMDMLRQTGRPETVVGWYHSHPGFGCWLSSVDINTQQSFEQLTPRAVAVVIDPIQSVKGKVVIDAFRLINPQTLMLGQEPRQTTSNLGHLNKPSIQALIHGLNRHYYSIGIGYTKTAVDERMLMSLHKKSWTDALLMPDFVEEGKRNRANIKKLSKLSEDYLKSVTEEPGMTQEQLRTRYVGKVDPKKHIAQLAQTMMEDSIVSLSRMMINKEIGAPSAGVGRKTSSTSFARPGQAPHSFGEARRKVAAEEAAAANGGEGMEVDEDL